MEFDVGAQVVSPGLALIAATARLARFDGDPLAHAPRRDSCSDLDYLAGRFVSQHEGAADHEITDSAVLVVMHVGSANSHRENPDEHFAWRWSWERALLDSQIVWRVQDRGHHRAVWLT